MICYVQGLEAVTPCMGTSVSGPRERGFSLIELVVAVFFIVLVVPLLVAMQIRVLKMNSETAQTDVAVWAAEAKLEELTTVDFATLTNGSEEIKSPDGHSLLRQWAVLGNNPEAGLRAVEVTVTDISIQGALPVRLWFVVGPPSP